MKFWIIYGVTAVVFIGFVLFILMWTFGLPLPIAAPLSVLALIVLGLIAGRESEAPPLVMRESRWLDVEGEKE